MQGFIGVKGEPKKSAKRPQVKYQFAKTL